MRVDCEELRSGGINPSQDQGGSDMTLMPDIRVKHLDESRSYDYPSRNTDRNNICFSMVIAVTTRGFRPVDRACSSMLEEMRAVVNSVSAAVPAPQHRIDSVM